MNFFRYIMILTVFFIFSGCNKSGTDEKNEEYDIDINGIHKNSDTDEVENGFTAYYFTEWSSPRIHFNDGTGWTNPPGKKMTVHDGKWFRYGHNIWNDSVTVVFNDSQGNWDNNNEKNYVSKTKVFWIKNGNVYDSRPDEVQTDSDSHPDEDYTAGDKDDFYSDEDSDFAEHGDNNETKVFDDTVISFRGENAFVSASGEDLKIYTISTTEDLRDSVPNSGKRDVIEKHGQMILRSGNLMFDALFAMALEEVRENSVEQISDGSFNNGEGVDCSCFETGEKWNYVWTRDTAYSAFLSLGLVEPVRTENSLMFKLSEKKAAAGGGNLQVIQDTGSGGSWPVSTDRVSWFLGASETIPFLSGESRETFKNTVYNALINTIETDRIHIFDAEDGLYRGEQSFLDWREQTYPPWTSDNTVHIGMSKTLSTNSLHYAALRKASILSEELSENERAIKYSQWAEDLKNAVDLSFTREDSKIYSSMKTTFLDDHSVKQFDLLGVSLAVIAGISDEEKALEMISSYPVTEAGPPVIWPQQPEIPIYHNRGIWPFVSAFFLRAAKAVDNTEIMFHCMKSIVNGAALNLSNMENFEFTTLRNYYEDGDLSGPVVNSRRQLWSVAGYLSMVFDVIFGISVENGDVFINPAVPASIIREYFPESDTVSLLNMPFRGKSLDISIEIPVPSADNAVLHTVSEVKLNKKSYSSNKLSLSDLQEGKNTVKFKLENSRKGHNSITLKNCADHRNCFTPEPVSIIGVSRENGEITVEWNEKESEVSYRIFRNGNMMDNNISSTEWTDPDSEDCVSKTCCYSVAAEYSVSGNISHHSDPQCWWGDDYERIEKITAEGFDEVFNSSEHDRNHFADWGVPGSSLTVSGWSPQESGEYLIQIEYGSGRPVDTGITACVKKISIFNESDMSEIASQTVFMPHLGIDNWGRWGNSSFASALLNSEKTYRFTISDVFNMSYFEHFLSYTGGFGGGEELYNRSNISTLKILLFKKTEER